MLPVLLLRHGCGGGFDAGGGKYAYRLLSHYLHTVMSSEIPAVRSTAGMERRHLARIAAPPARAARMRSGHA